MNYYSLKRNSPVVDFREAAIKGQAPDGGLYFPDFIPELDHWFFKFIDDLSNEEIAYNVIKPYVGETIPEDDLKAIVKETVNFPIPLVKVTDDISSLELFHGPTLAFKDVGARFMSRCLGYFSREENRKLIVLVATSGDTGGAVANGFYGVEGVDVFILYPSGKVSPVQEQQLTTLGKNIHAFEVEGSFDDCQKLVKQAFVDKELQSQLYLTSANSINIARWLPQQFYYFFAYKQLEDRSKPPVISVPSGNFGNIAAGLLAYRTGLPVKHFVAASNANDVVPRFFQNGKYEPRKTIPTISNAMDVGDPSNFVRILELFEDDLAELHKVISSYSITDDQTKQIIKKVYQDTNYLMDPHGAVGFLALQQYLNEHSGQKGIFLETAHPVKFNTVMEEIVKDPIEIPGSLDSLMSRNKSAKYIRPEFPKLKELLLEMTSSPRVNSNI